MQGVLIADRRHEHARREVAELLAQLLCRVRPEVVGEGAEAVRDSRRAPDATAIAHLQRDVVARYPSVSSLDLSLVQQTVANVLGKVTMAVRFLALISLALGVPVLFSAVAATRRERLREGVLLKTLGATRRQIVRIMLAEYALLGTLGAMTGVVLSTLAGWGLVHFIFRLNFVPAVIPAAIVAGGDDLACRRDRAAHWTRRVRRDADGRVA